MATLPDPCSEGISIPRDDEAEQIVAGTLVQSPFAMGNVAEIVTVDDFYDPRYGRLFLATQQLSGIGPFDLVQGPPVPWRPSSVRVRTAAAATLTDLPFSLVEKLVANTPVLTRSEPWARRMAEAAKRRRAMRLLADAYSTLGEGGGLEQVASVLNQVVAV